MTLTSISPETLVTSFSNVKEYVPLSGRTLGVTMSSVKVDFVTMDTRSPAVSAFSPKVHFAVGTGYPVIGTRIARGLGTITSRPSLNALRSRVGATVTREAYHVLKNFQRFRYIKDYVGCNGTESTYNVDHLPTQAQRYLRGQTGRPHSQQVLYSCILFQISGLKSVECMST